MSLTLRKVMVLGLIGSILLLGNVLLVANWLAEHGVVDWARSILEIGIENGPTAVISVG